MWALIFGGVFVGAGLVASTRSGILEARAAGERQIPLWRNSQGYRRPLASMLMLVAAGLLVGIGAVFFLIVWGTGAIFLLSLVFVPSFVVIAIHNKSTRRGI
jgi:hypothetical protein